MLHDVENCVPVWLWLSGAGVEEALQKRARWGVAQALREWEVFEDRVAVRIPARLNWPACILQRAFLHSLNGAGKTVARGGRAHACSCGGGLVSTAERRLWQ